MKLQGNPTCLSVSKLSDMRRRDLKLINSELCTKEHPDIQELTGCIIGWVPASNQLMLSIFKITIQEILLTIYETQDRKFSAVYDALNIYWDKPRYP